MASFFDIGLPCCDLLTSLRTRYPLSSIMCPYVGLRSWFSIGLRVHVELTCCHQGGIHRVRKPDNADKGLNVNRRNEFPDTKMFFITFVLRSLRFFKLKTKGQAIYRKPLCDFTKHTSTFSHNLGYLDRV